MLWGKMYFGNPHSVWVQIDFLCTTLHKDLPPSLLLLCPLPQSIYLTSTRSRRSAKLADIKKRETSNDEHLFIFCPLIVLGRRKSEVSTQNIKNTVIIHAPLASNRRHPTSTIRKFIKTTLKARSTFIPSLQRG